MGTFKDRLSHAWNAFTSRDKENYAQTYQYSAGASYGYRPDRIRLNISNERSLVGAIYTRMAIDVAAINMWHVRLDEEGAFEYQMNSGLNYCLTVEANIDQAARMFKQDIAMRLLDKGVIAIVPVTSDLDPRNSEGYDIRTLRVGEITAWFPEHVTVNLYNEMTGLREDITLPKKLVAIIENPLYAVMNEHNSTLQRLIRKLNLLDAVDDASSSGKLDLIIQLPYVIKSEARKQQAESRAKEIEMQLTTNKYGIAYTDGSERITQLNRPAENQLLPTIQYLTDMLYGQLGITEEVLAGTADEKTMTNYYNRTLEPILAAIQEGLHRTFLTRTARTQRQAVRFFRDPFAFVSVGDLAEVADKFTRNEILSSNEVRGIIGYKPVKSARADELVNKNIPTPESPPEET